MHSTKEVWESYKRQELETVVPLLAKLGYALDAEQPHTEGERFLMQAVTTESGRKLILLGRDETGRHVVIKVTRDKDGMRELAHERTCRTVLRDIGFAYRSFLSPEELLFVQEGPYLISIQAFIEQERPFLDRPLVEQFSLALQSFKAQESAHAATYEHSRLVKRTFGSRDASGYLKAFSGFRECVSAHQELLLETEQFLQKHQETIAQYSGFLTHTDFVPHNFRIKGSDIYLLDHSSLRFGNKYEGWARFLNFMALYNRPLEAALIEYVRLNRSEEELLSLKLMRIYRLGEILCYYTRTLERSDGNLRTLNEARISFWAQVLDAVYEDSAVPDSVLDAYTRTRDALRSEDEKRRQIGLH